MGTSTTPVPLFALIVERVAAAYLCLIPLSFILPFHRLIHRAALFPTLENKAKAMVSVSALLCHSFGLLYTNGCIALSLRSLEDELNFSYARLN
jgi:hypothetical protein